MAANDRRDRPDRLHPSDGGDERPLERLLAPTTPTAPARRHGHSTSWFKLAWRRFILIIRGGPRDKINRKLRAHGAAAHPAGDPRTTPSTRAARGDPAPIPEQMPQPRVALMWAPQTFGSPNISGNQPGDYWPGGRFVDWVGLDIYSKFAGAFDDGVALLSPLRHMAVRDRRVRALGQRLRRLVHRQALPLGRGARPGQDADLLPRRRPATTPTTCSSIPAPRRRCATTSPSRAGRSTRRACATSSIRPLPRRPRRRRCPSRAVPLGQLELDGVAASIIVPISSTTSRWRGWSR